MIKISHLLDKKHGGGVPPDETKIRILPDVEEKSSKSKLGMRFDLGQMEFERGFQLF